MTNTKDTPASTSTAIPPEAPPPGRVERAVKSLAPDILQGLCHMANDPTGFLTDRDPMRKNPENGLPWVPYTPDVFARCFLRMMDLGFKLAGNEVNIINGEPTVTLAGFARQIRENKDLIAFKESVSAPRLVAGRGWLVSISAEWELLGKTLAIERSIITPGPGGPGGEWAARRARLVLYSLVHEALTGQRLVPGEVQTEEQEKAILEQGPVPAVASEVLFAQPEVGTVPHPGEVCGQPQPGKPVTATEPKAQPVLTLDSDPTLPVRPTVPTADLPSPLSPLPSPASPPDAAGQPRTRRLSPTHRKLRDYLVAQGFTFNEVLNWVQSRGQFLYLGPLAWTDWADIPPQLAASWNRDRARIVGTLLRLRQKHSAGGRLQTTHPELN